MVGPEASAGSRGAKNEMLRRDRLKQPRLRIVLAVKKPRLVEIESLDARGPVKQVGVDHDVRDACGRERRKSERQHDEISAQATHLEIAKAGIAAWSRGAGCACMTGLPTRRWMSSDCPPGYAPCARKRPQRTHLGYAPVMSQRERPTDALSHRHCLPGSALPLELR